MRQSGQPVSAPSASRLGYFPALDGLRALAVISVLLYHADMIWLPGGFLGVEMFFVISGYLITSLLLAEWQDTGRIDFKTFWVRRARRLFPALFLLLLLVTSFAVAFLPTEVAGLRGDVLSTAGYVNNWHQVFSHKSYFESAGRPSLLKHMWSLAVEEQFYLVWPVVFGLLMARLRARQVLAVVVAGVFVSIWWMAFLFHPNSDPSRVYYGTDTRAAGLLIGVALAFFWRPGEKITEARSGALDALGLIALATVGACFVFLHEFQPFLYRGGFSLVGLATAELIAVAVHPSARLVPRLLAWSPLRWIGVRSYGIYLWHFPVFMVTRPQLDVQADAVTSPAVQFLITGVPWLLIRFLLTLGIAALSYHFIETPIRHGALGRAWKAWRAAQGSTKRRLGLRWATAFIFLLAAASTLGTLLLHARHPVPHDHRVAALNSTKVNGELGKTNPVPSAAHSSNVVAAIHIPSASSATGAPQVIVRLPPPVAPMAISNPVPAIRITGGSGVTAIGDSVMEGVAVELRQAFGTNTLVSAEQGRLPWNAPAIVRRLHAEGKIQPVVILHIGNNGFFSAEMFAQIMSELKDARRVVVVNLKVPRQWETLNNKMLATAVKSYPNAVLADWRGVSADRSKLFWKDGLHVRPEGAKVYADLIVQAVNRP